MAKTREDLEREMRGLDAAIKKLTKERDSNKKLFGDNHRSTKDAQQKLDDANRQLTKLHLQHRQTPPKQF